MDFELSKEHSMARTLFRDFAETEVEPLAEEIDENSRFPRETVDKLAKYGMLGIPYPHEYGGQGCDNLTLSLLIMELSKVCAATGTLVSVHSAASCGSIFKYGTEEQKKKYLIPLAKGEKIGSFALTEPGAGTDAAGVQTKAVLNGDHYIMNGSKIFITNGSVADVLVIFAMTDKSKGTKGISALIIEKSYPGFSIGKVEHKMGIRASATAELVFDNVRVPKENLLGQEGKGFNIAMATLDGGRIGMAAQAVGIAIGAFNKTVAYVKERKQFGRPIAAFQNTQFVMAELKARVEAAELLVYKAAAAQDEGKSYSEAAAIAKLIASETAVYVANKCLQLHGGYGFMKDYPLERMYRDAKIDEIYEGTSEVMKMVIAGQIFK
jgi:butyryl-CoA dehydrogenase